MPTQEEIDARIARYAATLDGRDLWPEVSAAAFRAAQEEMARVTVAVLAGAPSPIRLRLPPGADARALGVAVCVAGMGPLLGLWCETGRVAAPAPVADLLATHLDHGRRRAAHLRHELERILIALADRSIEAFVLKGSHTGYRYFPEPGTRPGSDIDLLVAPEDGPAARSVLRDLGFVDLSPTAPLRSQWTPPGIPAVRSLELIHADNPWSVDLHVSLDRAPFPGLTMALGSPDPRGGERWHEFSRPVRVLRQPLLLTYLALHASGHFYALGLVRLVEIVLVARRDFAGRPELWRALDELVCRTATGRFVFPALELAERLAPGTVDPAVREHARAAAPWRLRRLVHGTTPASAVRLHPYPGGERFIWAASPREFLACLPELAWPRDGGKLVPVRSLLGIYRRRLGRAFRWMLPAR